MIYVITSLEKQTSRFMSYTWIFSGDSAKWKYHGLGLSHVQCSKLLMQSISYLLSKLPMH